MALLSVEKLNAASPTSLIFPDRERARVKRDAADAVPFTYPRSAGVAAPNKAPKTIANASG